MSDEKSESLPPAPVTPPAVEMFASAFSPGYKIRVRRQRPDEAEHSYVGTIPAQEDYLERIQRQFGGGKFYLELRDGAGRIVKNETTMVAAGEPSAPSSPPGEAPASPSLAAEVKELRESLSRVIEKLNAPPAAVTAPAQNEALQMMREQMASQTEILKAALMRPEPKSFDTALVPMVVKMIEAGNQPTRGVQEFMEMAKFVNDLRGKAEKPGFLDQAAEWLPLVLPMFMPGGGTVPAPSPRPAMQAQPPAPVRPAENGEGAADTNGSHAPRPAAPAPFLKKIGELLNRGLQRNSSAELYADFALEICDSEADEKMLRAIVTPPDWEKNFPTTEAEHQRWITAWRLATLDLLTGEPAPETSVV